MDTDYHMEIDPSDIHFEMMDREEKRMIQVPFKLWDKLRSQSMTLESNLHSPDERIEDPRFKGTSMRLTFSEQDFKEVKEINKMIRDF